MIVFPNCKINLGLHIFRKRTDGYHDIETVMYPIAWNDALEFIPGESDSLTVTGICSELVKMEQNIVYKALILLRSHFDIPPLTIHLHKTIPSGAGLGGGSADGAFMLKALNNYFNLNLTPSELKNFALQLGSDCPFFIDNTPSLAKGRGELLSTVSVDLSGFTLLLVVPPIHSSTAEAYGRVKPDAERISVEEIVQLPVEQWRNCLVNDFEKSLFPIYPRLQEIKEKLYGMGAVYASLSGSGSTVYGVFKVMPAVEKVQFPDCLVKIIPGKNISN